MTQQFLSPSRRAKKNHPDQPKPGLSQAGFIPTGKKSGTNWYGKYIPSSIGPTGFYMSQLFINHGHGYLPWKTCHFPRVELLFQRLGICGYLSWWNQIFLLQIPEIYVYVKHIMKYGIWCHVARVHCFFGKFWDLIWYHFARVSLTVSLANVFGWID